MILVEKLAIVAVEIARSRSWVVDTSAENDENGSQSLFPNDLRSK